MDVPYTKAEARVYIPDAFRWMVQKGFIDLNDEAYPHTKRWNSDILDYESIPKLPTELNMNEMYKTMQYFMFTMDNQESNELLRRLQQKKVQTSIATTPAAAATTNSGKKAILKEWGGN